MSVQRTLAAAVATLLAALSLAPVFRDWSWYGPAAGAVAVVALTGELTRRVRGAPALHTLLAALFILDEATIAFAPQHAVFGVVPTRATISDLHQLLIGAGQDVRRFAPPVPTNPGLVLLVTLAVATLALLVDLMAVHDRRPALAGMPLLATYAVGSGLAAHGLPWWTFAGTGAGWLTLLVADSNDRLARWAGTGARALTPLGSVGRRLGAAALGVALVVPALVPGLHAVRFGGHGHGSGGSASVTTYNPILAIRSQLTQSPPRPLLTVSSSQPEYLRMTALDRFDGSTWSASTLSEPSKASVANGIPPPDGLTAVTTSLAQESVQVDGLAVHWLPVGFPPASVEVDGDWRYDPASGTVFSARDDTLGLRYQASSYDLSVDPSQLPGGSVAGMEHYLAVPAGLAAVRDIAVRVSAGAASPFEQAVRLQDWLRSPPFRYDTTVTLGNGTEAILAFLQSKRGFCVQYAATMAVMARLLGIPSRVAIGFTPGELQPDGSRVVTTADAHAWPELYFPGAGWVRFEPTPRGDGQVLVPGYAAVTPTPTQTPAAPRESPAPKTHPSAAPTAAPAGTRAHAGTGGGPLPWRALGWLALALALAGAPAGARALLRRRRLRRSVGGAAAAHAAWAELTDTAYDVGLPWALGVSPRRHASALLPRVSGPAAAALARLVGAEERARYAPTVPVEAVRDLATDVLVVRARLLAGASWRRRWLARLTAPSVLRRGALAVGSVLGAPFEASDRLAAAVRRRFAGGS